MDKHSVHQPKRNKQTKAKKKPIKVVYISNPVKVTTSASEFRALVQELTGQDSDPAELARFSDISQATPEISKVDAGEPDSPNLSESIASDGAAADPIYPFDFFGDIFAQQMVESFSGLLPPPLRYEPLLGSCSREP